MAMGFGLSLDSMGFRLSSGEPEAVEGDTHAIAGPGLDLKLAADLSDSPAHVFETVGAAGFDLAVKAASVVPDEHTQGFVGGQYQQRDFRGARMAYDVAERLLDGQEKIMPDLRRDRFGGRILGQIQVAANAGGTHEIRGELADVVDEVRQRIVGGIDGPDDFIERIGRLAGRRGDFI